MNTGHHLVFLKTRQSGLLKYCHLVKPGCKLKSSKPVTCTGGLEQSYTSRATLTSDKLQGWWPIADPWPLTSLWKCWGINVTFSVRLSWRWLPPGHPDRLGSGRWQGLWSTAETESHTSSPWWVTVFNYTGQEINISQQQILVDFGCCWYICLFCQILFYSISLFSILKVVFGW